MPTAKVQNILRKGNIKFATAMYAEEAGVNNAEASVILAAWLELPEGKRSISALNGQVAKPDVRMTEETSEWRLPGIEILDKKTRHAVEQNLSSNDTVEFCIKGGVGQAIVALVDRLLIVKVGVSVGATFGAKVTSFDYSDIRGIEVRTGFLHSWIEVVSAGYESTAQKKNPKEMPNCIEVHKESLPGWQTQIQKLRVKVTKSKTTSTIQESNGNLVAQLNQLGALRASGVLSEEDFQKAKSKLLS